MPILRVLAGIQAAFADFNGTGRVVVVIFILESGL